MAGTITALRVQKGNAQRVNVYLDGRYGLALPILTAATLRRGQFLSDEDIACLKAIDEEEKAYERAVRFLARRPRSIAETQRYLRRRPLPDPVIDRVIQRLATAGYLDDRLFAQFWVEDRERFRPRGQAALRHELRQKGLPDQIIDEALQALDAEDSAYRAATAYAPRLARLDRPTFRQKLGGYLLRRGFGHEVVWPVVERTWQELRDDDGQTGWIGD
jgi:regulatory protein